MFNLLSKKVHNKKGFTLIELIVVIAILGILAAVLLPRFLGFSDNAKNGSVISDCKNIATAIESLTALDKTFEDTTTATNGIYSPGELMAYVGKQLGGELVWTNASGAVTQFIYTKKIGNDYYQSTFVLANTNNTSAKIAAPGSYTVTAMAAAAP